MFDLRYHVASLAAVFFALVIGILVGVALASHGLGHAERQQLEHDLHGAQSDNAKLQDRLREYRKDAAFVDNAYDAVMNNRLRGMRIAVLFIGKADDTTRGAIEQTISDAGGTVLRLRAISVPVDATTIEKALGNRKLLASFTTGSDRFRRIGVELADEFIVGHDTPLWDALESHLVEERSGSGKRTADAVVVARTAPPQTRLATAQLVSALLSELANVRTPVIGVERDRTVPSSVRGFSNFGLSTVDDINLSIGRVALAVVLSSPPTGAAHYGLRDGETILPTVPPVTTQTTTTTGIG
ncbi:MAG TPA: copper transporter [Gaiellaceae bacterium]|nr:copper transporter [Gaiellaceae bacterium]